MVQIIISIIIFILVGIISVDTVKAGRNYYHFKIEIERLQSDQQLGGTAFLNREGIDREELAKLMDVISRGISEEDLKSLLSEMGASEAGIQKILERLDAMGAATITPPADSSAGQKLTIKTKSSPPRSPMSGSGGEGGMPADSSVGQKLTIKTKSSPPVKSPEDGEGGNSGNATSSEVTEQTARITSDRKLRQLGTLSTRIAELPKIQQQVTELREAQTQALQSLKTAEPEVRKTILTELQTKRQALVENIQTSRQEVREQAETIRSQFREKMEAAKKEGAVGDGGLVAYRAGATARVAIAHAYGVRVANRFQAAIARLENILNRLESRTAKLQAEGNDVSEVAPAIEEAKNTLAESKAKLVELEATYEEMLVSENPSELAREAAAKVKELKNQLSEIMEAAKTAGKDIRRGMVIAKPGTNR